MAPWSISTPTSHISGCVWVKSFGPVWCTWAQTLSFHLASMGSLQSTWKARGEDSDIYLFWVLLNDLHWDMWYHRSFPFTVVATQLLHIALTSYGPCHRGVNAPCFTKTRTITMSPSENFTSEVGLNCVSFVKSDCCCFRAAFIVWLARSTMPELCGRYGMWNLCLMFSIWHICFITWPVKCVPWSDSIWIGAPQSGRIWFATTRATVSALLLRVGIASTHLENLSIITRQ